MRRLAWFCFISVLFVQLEAKTTSLGKAPEWDRLAPYSGTMTAEAFRQLLDKVYAPSVMHGDFFRISEEGVSVYRETGRSEKYDLSFAKPGQPVGIKRYWRSREELRRGIEAGGAPLKGVRIALDPGHIGGEWALVERRYFQLGDDKPIAEGELTLALALRMKDSLEGLGADVSLVRIENEPITPYRPDDFQEIATRIVLEKEGQSALLSQVSASEGRIREMCDILFYRVSEIRERARKVNSILKPDLVLALHFNAEPWPVGEKRLIERDHLHVLVNGAYSREELAYDDMRFEMLLKLFQRSAAEEIGLADSVSRALADVSGLPPFTYKGDNASEVIANPYVWARNLLANRLYECPVVFLEAYCMNGAESYPRLQMGDYRGYREIGGQKRMSVFREYTDGVVNGLVDYYRPREAQRSLVRRKR